MQRSRMESMMDKPCEEKIARECKQACEQYYNAQQEAKRKAMTMKNLKAYISKLQEMRCTDLHKRYREHCRSCNEQLMAYDRKIEALRDELIGATMEADRLVTKNAIRKMNHTMDMVDDLNSCMEKF